MATTPAHDGFYIPNAGDSGVSPRMAEPDKIDFNTLGNALWGVIEGCVASVAGSLVTVGVGTYIVNGQLRPLTMQNVSLGTGGAQDRFDLIVADVAGTVKVVSGLSAVDPVYPDPPDDVTVLAAVFCPSGISNFTGNLVDKRKFLSNALLTKIPASGDLIRNLNGSGNLFKVTGDGIISWGADTQLSRLSAALLQVRSNLTVDANITAGGSVIAASLLASGYIGGANFQQGSVLPGTATPGTIFQMTSGASAGQVFIRTSTAWEQLTTVASAVPLGTVISSVEVPEVMIPLGWIPLDGRSVNEGQYPNLFKLAALASTFAGTAPTRTMNLPNGSKRMLLTDFTRAPGTLDGPNPGNKLVLQKSQMPIHSHSVTTTLSGGFSSKVRVVNAGDHSHVVSGGTHSHPNNVAAHNLFDTTGTGHPAYAAGSMYIAEPAIQIPTGSIGHSHLLSNEGSHTHAAYTDPVADHTHAVTEQGVGGNTSIDVTPEYMTLYSYIRS